MARKYNKRRNKKNKRTTIQKSLTMSSNQVARLRYVQKIILDPNTGGIGSYRFRANGCYDPDFTGTLTGHQPLGWDQWSTFYDEYQVIGSKMTLLANMQQESGAPVFLTAICNDDNNYSPSNIETVLEQGMAKYKFMQSRTGSPSFGKLNCYYSPKKIFGIDKPRDNRIFTSSVDDVPAEQAYYTVSVVSDELLDNPTAVSITVQIDYTVLFTSPKTLAQS